MLRPFPQKYHDNGDHGRSDACCLCGKPCEDRLMVEVIDGGSSFVRTTDDVSAVESARADGAGYIGWFPVGPDCAKKLRKDSVVIKN